MDKDRMYQKVLAVYGSKDKWEKSILCRFKRWVELNMHDNYFQAKVIYGLQKEKERRWVVGDKEMNLIEKFLFLVNARRIMIPLIECSIGMVCTLRCKYCNQMNYKLKEKSYFEINSVINNMKKVIDAVDFIYQVSIAGGEALGHPELEKLLEFLTASEKVGYIVIVTNGTLYPTEKVIHAMKNKKVLLSVSPYPLVETENRDKIFNKLPSLGVHVYHNNENATWCDFGPLENRHYSDYEKKEAYTWCWLKDVLTMIDGTIYRCEKSYVLRNLKLEEPQAEEYIEIGNMNRAQLRKRIKDIYKLKSVNACNYCDFKYERKIVPAGEQLLEEGK